MEPQPLPERDRVQHGSELLAELQSALGPSAVTAEEPPAVGANAALDLASPGLVDTVQLSKGAAAYVDSAEASAVLFFEDPSARTFRRKLERYADPEQVTARGQPRSNALVAPIERIRRPTLVDLAEAWDVEAALATGDARVWIELWTPGGRLGKAELRERIAAAVADFADLDSPGEQLQRFEAAEHDIWLAHLTPAAIRQLPRALPPVTSIHPPSQARLERRAREAVGTAIAEQRIDPPASRTACIAILDSGVAEDHPLLREALVAPGVSVVPGVTSAQDAYPGGHGTGVAGVAAYRALAQDLVDGGRVRPASRFANVRLWSPDGDAILWANRTVEAVEAAEATAEITVHLLCLSSGARPISPRTSWSFAADQLAYNDGAGRLICIAAGNVTPEPDPDAYPATNQASELHDPAQAINALTVGGITDLDALRGDRAGLAPVAQAGQLSPHTTTGTPGAAPIKPELVMEAGNACPDGTLPNIGLEELSVLTTSVRHARGRQLESDSGTSVGAALLAGLLSDIATSNPGRRPETVRALAVNSARWSPAMHAQFPEKAERLRCVGYGAPRLDHAAVSTSARATLVHEGELAPYSTEGRMNDLHLLRLPLPDEELLALGGTPVEMAVTLSYFVEPHETRRTQYAGAWLQWDLQRQLESEADFLARINDRDRDPHAPPDEVDAWPWEIGVNPRRRGSIQSDRLTVDAAALAGDRLISVFPVGGWWRDHLRRRAGRHMKYSVVVTVDAGQADVDLYSLIQIRLPVDVPADVLVDVPIEGS